MTVKITLNISDAVFSFISFDLPYLTRIIISHKYDIYNNVFILPRK